MKKQKMVAKLVHKISFLKKLSNNPTEDLEWIEDKTTYAEIKHASDNRFFAIENISFGSVISEKYFLFSMRFIKDINCSMRIRFNDRIFEIKRIIDKDERGRILTIVALEI